MRLDVEKVQKVRKSGHFWPFLARFGPLGGRFGPIWPFLAPFWGHLTPEDAESYREVRHEHRGGKRRSEGKVRLNFRV